MINIQQAAKFDAHLRHSTAEGKSKPLMKPDAGLIPCGDDTDHIVCACVLPRLLQNELHQCRRNPLPPALRGHIDGELYGRSEGLFLTVGGQTGVTGHNTILLRHIERMIFHIVRIKPRLSLLHCLRVDVQRGHTRGDFIIINLQQPGQIRLPGNPQFQFDRILVRKVPGVRIDTRP